MNIFLLKRLSVWEIKSFFRDAKDAFKYPEGLTPTVRDRLSGNINIAELEQNIHENYANVMICITVKEH